MTNKKIRIAFIANGFGLPSHMSGGEIRLFNILKRLPSCFAAVLYTTEGGILAAKSYPGLSNIELREVKSAFFSKKEFSGFQRFLGYIISAFNCSKALKNTDFDIIYTSSDFFCDTLPAHFAAKNKTCKWTAMTHHRYASPFKRPGNFIKNMLFYLMQSFSFRLISKNASALLSLETQAGEEIKTEILKLGFKGKFFSVQNGVDVIRKTSHKKDKKLALYVGGLRASKGLYDIIPIWKTVSAAGAYKLIIVGKGSAGDINYLKNEISSNNLGKNIELAGYASDAALKKYLSRAFLFFLPSHEEGWGISVIDALMYANHVIVYNLPAFKVFGGLIEKIKCFDKDAYAKAVIETFKASKTAKTPNTFLNKYNWDNIAKKEFKTLESINREQA